MRSRDLSLRSRWLPLAFMLGVLFAPILALPSEGTAARGAVVTHVSPYLAAEKAGLRRGDIVLGWSRPAASPANPSSAQGAIVSPFDLAHVETEQGPRGAVTLAVERDGRPETITLGQGRWGIDARPRWTAVSLALDEQARALQREGRAVDAAEGWRRLARRPEGPEGRVRAAWVLLEAAKGLIGVREWAEADRALEDALAQAEGASDVAAAQVLIAAADSHERRSAWARAEDCLRRAVARYEAQGNSTLAVAARWHRIGYEAYFRGDLDAAQQHYGRALAIRDREAPQSADLATTLRELGAVARERGDWSLAESYSTRALSLHEASIPETPEHVASLQALATVHFVRGDFARRDMEVAQEILARALAIAEATDKGGPQLAGVLNLLAGVAQARGDFAAAEEYLGRVLTIMEKRSPGSQDVGGLLGNLGILAYKRSDWPAAHDLFERARAIHERYAPASPLLATTLHHIGLAELKLGELDLALAHLERARDLLERQVPGGRLLAATWQALGEVSLAQGDAQTAEDRHRRALSLYQRLTPESLDVAGAFAALAALAQRRGEMAEARDLYRSALDLQGRLASGTALEASTLHELGMIESATGNAGPAAELLCRAIDSLEQQRARLGGTQEARAAFAAEHADFHHDCLAAQLALKASDEAFRVLERSRARELLDLLAERDLLATAAIPEALAIEARRIDREYDRVQARMTEVSVARQQEEARALVSRLRELRVSREQLRSEIRKSAPRFAELRYPQPLGRAETQRVLDEGTALLSYSVGRETTFLFVLTKTDYATFELPVGRDALDAAVSRFRRLLERGRLGPEADEATRAEGAGLFRLLIAPASSAIERSERLLLCPAGPLHSLPFAALLRAPGAGKGYLVEWKPLHVVVSATVYAEVLRSRVGAEVWPVRLAAFGDPVYPTSPLVLDGGAGDASVHSPVAREFRFAPLPASRLEIERVAAELAPSARRVYLGRQATEERVRSLGPDVRYVHFACHGYLDRRLPLDSALALSPPERLDEARDNGLLQAWEIFERMRIRADLVTLSACESGLGQEMGGEGLLGLTRAFQYAGARSILASLWRITDRSTAELMPRFYRHLKQGKTKDEALRAAQLEFIRGRGGHPGKGPRGRLRHPFYWAAFQLTGDWR